MLEQQIVRDFDNIHEQLQQLNEHALDQVDMLANQLAKRDQRAILQAQRTQDFYTGIARLIQCVMKQSSC
ncbi:hypothetical protein [Acinetobacter sp. ANC 4973]|uniref:hypothetical protein n=1 Tax=Acinetobacter sp. ANC 4973 TaxID=1977871 RepID=UPI001D0D699E|nr:hypothetical protein [Acinetobacter sp. ANC 4973]